MEVTSTLRGIAPIFSGEDKPCRGPMIWYVAAGSALGGMARFLVAGWEQRTANATIHSDRVLRLSVDLRIVVECVDTDEKIQSVIPPSTK